MTEDPNERDLKDDEAKVVDDLLSELGVDDEMKKELVESGKISKDILKVQSADQVKRRFEIEKSTDRLRDSLRKLEKQIIEFEKNIDRIERDLIPVVLSFLVGLKGNLVNMRTNIIARGKRRAKTNLQVTYVENEVKEIVDDEFSGVEDTLTSGMSAPILEKVRDITEELKANMNSSIEDFTDLKSSFDDFSQRAITELEFLTKELTMKPRVEIPKEVSEKLKSLERQVEELTRDLRTSDQKVMNRESELEKLQQTLKELKARNETLEDTLNELKSSPAADKGELAELRQSLKAMEASREVVMEKLESETKRVEEAEARILELGSDLAKKELEVKDHMAKQKQLQDEVDSFNKKIEEIDDLRARIRSYESGDKMRELDRAKSELDRAQATVERLTKEYENARTQAQIAQKTIDNYMELMSHTEKTKAYLMAEENPGISLKEIRKSLGVSPAVISKWAEEFVELGIAEVVEGDKIRPVKNIED